MKTEGAMCGLEALCSRSVQFMYLCAWETLRLYGISEDSNGNYIERYTVAKNKIANILAVILGQLY